MKNPIVDRVVESLGSVKRLADICGVRPPSIHYWTQIPARHCLIIFDATKIPLHELRPDVYRPIDSV